MRPVGKFVTGNLWRHIFVMTFTSAVSLITTFIVDLVDILFISHLGDSSLAAGVGFAASILYFIRSLSVALGIATGVLVSRAIGRGRGRQAARYAFNASVITIIIITTAILVTACNQERFLSLVGATGASLQNGKEYLSIILSGSLVLCLGMCSSAIIRAHGGATLAMWVGIASALTNAILDPIFIFGLGWGLRGAAIATIISYVVLFVFGWWIIFYRYRLFSPIRWRFIREDFPDVMAVAVPSMLTSLSAPLTTAFAARQIAQFGTDMAAGFVVIMRITPVAFAMTFSLSGSIAPIVGQNAGAGLFLRARQTLNNAIIFNWLIVIVVSGLLFLLRNSLPHWFYLTPAAGELIHFYCAGVAFFFGFNGMIFCCNAAFNNLGRPFYSTLTNFSRVFCGSLPIILIAGHFFGAYGVVFGFVAEGILVAPVVYWIASRLLKDYLNGMPFRTQKLRDLLHF